MWRRFLLFLLGKTDAAEIAYWRERAIKLEAALGTSPRIKQWLRSI